MMGDLVPVAGRGVRNGNVVFRGEAPGDKGSSWNGDFLKDVSAERSAGKYGEGGGTLELLRDMLGDDLVDGTADLGTGDVTVEKGLSVRFRPEGVLVREESGEELGEAIEGEAGKGPDCGRVAGDVC